MGPWTSTPTRESGALQLPSSSRVAAPPREDLDDLEREERIERARDAAKLFASKAMSWNGRDAYVLAHLLNRHAEACHDLECALGDSSREAEALRGLVDWDDLPSARMPCDATGRAGVWAADLAGNLVVTGGAKAYRDVLLMQFEVCHVEDLNHPA